MADATDSRNPLVVGRASWLVKPSRTTRCLGICSVALLLGLAALLGAVTEVRASTVQALSIEDLTRKAVLVIVAVPTAERARLDLDGKTIVTDVSLRVEDVLKGQAKRNTSVVATVLGGTLDDLALQVPGEAGFELNRRVLVFLYRAPTSQDLRVVGMSQGVLPLVQQGTATMVLPGGAGAALVDRGSDGVLRDAPAALLEPQPLGELLDRIRKAVRAQHP